MPRLARCDFAASSSADLRALMAILAPISPSPCAICRPSPRDPPVIRATFPLSSNNSRTATSGHLEQAGRALAPADAHGDNHELGAAPPAFDQRMSGQPGAAHAVRMADRDGAAV